jgi:hypothetical protein
LIDLKLKLDELTKQFQILIQNKENNKNGADILESLINLQSNIINKKKLIDQKSAKIDSMNLREFKPVLVMLYIINNCLFYFN